METKVTRGDRALAEGAFAAGVQVVSGYPGSPATGVFDALIEMTDSSETHVRWAPNEKVAMEIAFGASLAGSRSLVVLKSVGMNIALDPLATVSLTGCHAGIVILLGDDPGGWASQNEQDSRWAARIAEVPVFEPTSVESAAVLVAQAFAWSESARTPVIVRITRALALAEGIPDPPWELPPPHRPFYRQRNRWIALPYLVTERHHSLHMRLREIQRMAEVSPYDQVMGDGPLGILAVGYMHTKLREVLRERAPSYGLFGLASAWPLPERRLSAWLAQRQRVLVLEEGGPFVEGSLRALAQREGLAIEIIGRDDRLVPTEGELGKVEIEAALAHLDPEYATSEADAVERAMPSKTPLCEDCPYRPTLDALVEAMERNGGHKRHIVVGETGCMVRANLPPMELFDVKYSLGSGLGLGLGLAISERRHRVVALVGDSSFLHSDINAMPHAVQIDAPLLLVVLDNGTTALTGGQPHPGSAQDERGKTRLAADIATIIEGCGIEVQRFTPADRAEMVEAFDAGLNAEGMTVVIVRGPCPRYVEA